MRNVRASISLLCGLLLQAAVPGANASSETSVHVQDATTSDQGVAGAIVTFSRPGERPVIATSDEAGAVRLTTSFADDASTSISITKVGFSGLDESCPCANRIYSLSPTMTNLDGYRLVLTWDAHDLDLDSHLKFGSDHVSYLSRTGLGAQVDVDAKRGGGREVVTIERRQQGQQYIYAVHDYRNHRNPKSTALAASGARVSVYAGQTLLRTYYVPTGKAGNLWAVFTIDENGEFRDINELRAAISPDKFDPSDVLGVLARLQNYRAPAPIGSPASTAMARELNHAGEMAYRDGRLEEALRHFQGAVDHDPAYGEAFSNLGLTFQKLGRAAEALWANRKATTLAAGDNARSIRASAHYNNGRIYEDALQFEDARREYVLAKAELSSQGYVQAIERMTRRIAAR